MGRRIAKISGTPGKTRALNVFLVDLGRREKGEVHPPSPLSLYFLDLPGYGYARAGKAQRADFKRLVRYALRRERLNGVVWLLDIRHPPSAEDRAMQELMIETETRVLAALTKADKLTAGQRRTRGRELQEDLGLPEDQLVVTSAKTGDGIVELREAIGSLIGKATA